MVVFVIFVVFVVIVARLARRLVSVLGGLAASGDILAKSLSGILRDIKEGLVVVNLVLNGRGKMKMSTKGVKESIVKNTGLLHLRDEVKTKVHKLAVLGK
jgi:hypothetical protein